MSIFDISRARFLAPMDREACIELASEDKLPEDGDAVGLLVQSMYGFRTASATWMTGKERLNEVVTRLELQIPLCSTTQRNVAEE